MALSQDNDRSISGFKSAPDKLRGIVQKKTVIQVKSNFVASAGLSVSLDRRRNTIDRVADFVFLSFAECLARVSATHEAPILKDNFQCSRQIVRGICFDHVTLSSAKRLLHHSGRRLLTYEKYLRARGVFPYLSRRFNAIESRKPDVQQNQVGLQFPGPLNRLWPVSHFAGDPYFRMFLKDRADKAPPWLRIIDDQSAEWSSRHSSLAPGNSLVSERTVGLAVGRTGEARDNQYFSLVSL